jgi:hypothetical protein
MRRNAFFSAGSSDSSFAARVVARTPLLEAFARFFAETYRSSIARKSVAGPIITNENHSTIIIRSGPRDVITVVVHASARSTPRARDPSTTTTRLILARAVRTPSERIRARIINRNSIQRNPTHASYRARARPPAHSPTRPRRASRTFTFANAPRRARCDIISLAACAIVSRRVDRRPQSMFHRHDRSIVRSTEASGRSPSSIRVLNVERGAL